MTTNRYVTIKTHIEGAPKESDFELKSEKLNLSAFPAIGYLSVKTLYVSVDPYQINRMKRRSTTHGSIIFSFPLSPGQVISALGLGRVVHSANSEFCEGDLVIGALSWAEYTVVAPAAGGMLRKLDPMGFPLTYHLGILGFGGLAAYAGLFKLCTPKKGEKVFVSTASGSVGNLVGQFAKLFGCYVVGCTGTQEKVNLLKDKLGFDGAFNYKEEPDLDAALKRHFPDGIDIYFDNVGSKTLEAAIANMNHFGRVAACGVTSEYTGGPEKRAVPNMVDVIYKRIKIHGFLAPDHMDVFPDFISMTSDYLRSGKIQVLEDVSCGLENVASAFVGLFRGDNVGKKVVQIAE